MIYPGDWGKYEQTVRYYSSNNRDDFNHIWKVGGYDLFGVMGGLENIKTDQDYVVTFIAKDGLDKTRTVSQLQSQYFYPHFDVAEGERVAPMVGFYRTDLYEHLHLPDPADVVWEDKKLQVDVKVPRLILGQTCGDVSEKTQPDYLKELVRIVVGGERPAGSDGKQTTDPKTGGDGTTKSGEGEDSSPSKPGEVEDKAGVKDKQDEDTVSKDGNDKDNNKDEDKNRDEIGEGEDGADVTAPGAEEEDSLDTDESKGGETRKVRWPWIAACAVVVGLAGGGIYYYIRRRKT